MPMPLITLLHIHFRYWQIIKTNYYHLHLISLFWWGVGWILMYCIFYSFGFTWLEIYCIINLHYVNRCRNSNNGRICHHHHHHVPEGLGVFPVSWSSRWSWSLQEEYVTSLFSYCMKNTGKNWKFICSGFGKRVEVDGRCKGCDCYCTLDLGSSTT